VTKAALRRVASPTKKPFRSCLEAITAAGYKPGEQVSIALDIPLPASSTTNHSGNYVFKKSDKSRLLAQMAAYWTAWVKNIHRLHRRRHGGGNDWAGWKSLTQSIGKQII